MNSVKLQSLRDLKPFDIENLRNSQKVKLDRLLTHLEELSAKISANSSADDKEHMRRTINHIFQTIMERFPNIIISPEDVNYAKKFSQILVDRRKSFMDQWAKSTTEQRPGVLHHLFVQPYSQTAINGMTFSIPNISDMDGIYDPRDDTVAIGRKHLERSTPENSLRAALRVMQHRRQHRLIDRLDARELQQGSAEHYLARLLKVNLKSGYNMIANESALQPARMQSDLYAILIAGAAGIKTTRLEKIKGPVKQGVARLVAALKFRSASLSDQDIAPVYVLGKGLFKKDGPLNQS